ncbi:MAG: cupin domain-containing protein [Pseudonocardiaceae bacterium]
MTLQSRNLDEPDEVRKFTNGEIGVVTVPGAVVGRAAFQPGWRWSEDVKPLAGTESCEAAHTGYIISGRMHVVMDDGAEADLGPGDAFVISPGHDAWIVGDENCVALDWSAAGDYPKPAE